MSKIARVPEQTAFSPLGAQRTNEVTKGLCIQVQRCSKPTHDHAAS